MSSVPVVKRTLVSLDSNAKEFEKIIEGGKYEGPSDIVPLLDKLASEVADGQRVVERVQRLHTTFNEKVSQPFAQLQRDTQDTGSNELPIVHDKISAAQQVLVRTSQLLVFEGLAQSYECCFDDCRRKHTKPLTLQEARKKQRF